MVFFPYLLRVTLRAIPLPLAELLRRAFAPAWTLGAALAAALVAVRLAFDPEDALAVAGTALAGLAAYWAAYYALVLDPGERALVRALPRRGGAAAS